MSLLLLPNAVCSYAMMVPYQPVKCFFKRMFPLLSLPMAIMLQDYNKQPYIVMLAEASLRELITDINSLLALRESPFSTYY